METTKTFKHIITGQEFEFQYENEVWTVGTRYNDIYYENANVDFAGLKNQDIKYIKALLKYPASFDLIGDNLMVSWEVDILGNVVIHLNKIAVPKQITAALKEKDAEISELKAELKKYIRPNGVYNLKIRTGWHGDRCTYKGIQGPWCNLTLYPEEYIRTGYNNYAILYGGSITIEEINLKSKICSKKGEEWKCIKDPKLYIIGLLNEISFLYESMVKEVKIENRYGNGFVMTDILMSIEKKDNIYHNFKKTINQMELNTIVVKILDDSTGDGSGRGVKKEYIIYIKYE